MAKAPEPSQLAEQILAALDATSYRFPDECRGSVAIPRLSRIYESAFASD
jgi:hypothetical protein